MLPLTLNPAESELLTRILEMYLEELRNAAAGSASAEIESRRQREEPMLRDLLGQLAASHTTA